MRSIIALMVALLPLQASAAGCGFFGLFQCHHRVHHHQRHTHHTHVYIIHKKVIIVRKPAKAPIEPVKPIEPIP
jgi:hypothetical protein